MAAMNVYVLDGCALIAYLRDEPSAERLNVSTDHHKLDTLVAEGAVNDSPQRTQSK
jgi:hypothetical protein